MAVALNIKEIFYIGWKVIQQETWLPDKIITAATQITPKGGEEEYEKIRHLGDLDRPCSDWKSVTKGESGITYT